MQAERELLGLTSEHFSPVLMRSATGDASDVPARGEPTKTTLLTLRFARRNHHAVTRPPRL